MPGPRSGSGAAAPIHGRMLDFAAVLRYVVESNASDLHLKVGLRPRIRVDGQLSDAPFDRLTDDDLEALCHAHLRSNHVIEFAATNEADFGLTIRDAGRFRCNLFRQQGSIGMVIRQVATTVPSIAELGLPPVVSRLADEARGLVLVTGPTGSGKTTTLASMIEQINATRAVNIVTIEDPIEVVHREKLAMINQREIGIDTLDYAQAMRRVLRQDPDVILVGEMRDAETVSAALSAAETGHMVFSTLHTSNAAETINRMVDFVPAAEQRQMRRTIAGCLKGVVSQRLLERAVGSGRVPAVEVMVTTGRIAERIANPDAGQAETIDELIADGEWYGMQTFDQSLLSLFKNGLVTLPDAMAAASNPHDFRLSLQGAGLIAASNGGVRASGMA
jgi:twitching motility protein PilT